MEIGLDMLLILQRKPQRQQQQWQQEKRLSSRRYSLHVVSVALAVIWLRDATSCEPKNVLAFLSIFALFFNV